MTAGSFDEFFHALWGREPFPWQSMLADRVAAATWPKVIELPTAAGKTACVDIALYALAAQAERTTGERSAPRRIWFVVDRRIVVDEAHQRAVLIASRLRSAATGPLRRVADALRRVAGTDRPLAVGRLRGGILRDDGWARVPSQPAVITSTVDQVGSRILFRAYGSGRLAAPIYAGLAANDSLIILDEAHCSVPFLQTMRSIEFYRGAAWATHPLPSPFAFTVMSATPPGDDVDRRDVFPGRAETKALDHPVLRSRLAASKPAVLVEVRTAADQGADALAKRAASEAQSYVVGGARRVAVMVNRVRTAEETARALREAANELFDVVLLTGRLRPLERDALVHRWQACLRAADPEEPHRPVVVVATQCLEVGADFSFDALVTEAASLDALRQRFGRLNRMGGISVTPATILIRDLDARGEDPDPIYGDAVAATWRLLSEKAARAGKEVSIDFGVRALHSTLRDVDDVLPYCAPAPDAPILLPAHLDLLCQTSASPYPEPDVHLFLHGIGSWVAEAQVVWRCDLSVADSDASWLESVALCPPSAAETLSVPLYRLRAWLAIPGGGPDDSGDVEGVGAIAERVAATQNRRFVIWRGRDTSTVVRDPTLVGPGDVVVIPADYGIDGLGQSEPHMAVGESLVDLWEPAVFERGRAVVRLNRRVLGPWLTCPPLAVVMETAEDPVLDRGALNDAVDAALGYRPTAPDDPPAPPKWWLTLLREARTGRIERHPGGGVVLMGRRARTVPEDDEIDLFADDDDLTSSGARDVSLDEHTRLVQRTVERIAELCLPSDIGDAVELAGHWHDAGKLDERFQMLLRRGNVLAVLSEKPIAKSANVPVLPGERRTVRCAAGLPDGFRHEMLSMQLAEQQLAFEDREVRDLILHLIASHHGYGRPFAPIVEDASPPGIAGRLGDVSVQLTAAARAGLSHAHRIDSGVVERFWASVRRHGWWGEAYLAAVLRLSDWYASRLTESANVVTEAAP